ncbi:rod shape-determining protein MreD [Candidatus Oscillochloris fontis]|uniref:rod shape-determining protein MreD n=1 Tax=Candidatus Oscillochloris fontis TaxID=2496868 RepID=UPI00101D5DFD|nr:rod shape-determining protein MreD [Candidatus Oscillochloris fontis]
MGDSQSKRVEELVAREVGYILLIGVLALVQVTLLRTPLGFSAPLLLVITICRTLIGMGAAFRDIGMVQGVRWAFYSGLMLDILAATPLGTHAFALLLATITVAFATRRLRIEGPLLPLLAMLVASLIYESVMALLIQPGPVMWGDTLRVALIPGTLLALIMTLPIFFLLRWMLRA